MWAIMRAKAMPSWPSREIAARAALEKPMFCAVSFALAQISTARSTSCGWSSAHCSACIPPSEPPIAACSRSTPSSASSARWTLTRSRTLKSGKSRP